MVHGLYWQVQPWFFSMLDSKEEEFLEPLNLAIT